jgi:hypothetical protein
MVMAGRPDESSNPCALTWARVAESALRQAARHEQALDACLTELSGVGAPTPDAVEAALGRARHHAFRATGLAATAVRINDDPAASASLAAALEHHERSAQRVADLCATAELAWSVVAR